VGYRVNSRRGIRFRQWATNTLRDHLVRGYTLNERRLAERGLDEARQTLDLLARTLLSQVLVNDTGRAVLDLIVGYADTWRLLLEYDEDRLAVPAGARPSIGVLDHAKAVAAIADFKRELMARNEATPLFGNSRGDALDGILASIEQTMFGEPLVPHARGEGGTPAVLRRQGPPLLRRQQAHRLLPVHALPSTGGHRRPSRSAHADRARAADRRERPCRQGPDDPADREPARRPIRMTAFTESIVEQAALDWLQAADWTIAHGPEIAPDQPDAERAHYGHVILESRLRGRLGPTEPADPG
jgi:hypothetical protein